MTLFFHVIMGLTIKFNGGPSRFSKDHPLGSIIFTWLFFLSYLSDVVFLIIYSFTGWYISELILVFITLSVITYPAVLIIAALKQRVYDPWNEKLKQ